MSRTSSVRTFRTPQDVFKCSTSSPHESSERLRVWKLLRVLTAGWLLWGTKRVGDRPTDTWHWHPNWRLILSQSATTAEILVTAINTIQSGVLGGRSDPKTSGKENFTPSDAKARHKGSASDRFFLRPIRPANCFKASLPNRRPSWLRLKFSCLLRDFAVDRLCGQIWLSLKLLWNSDKKDRNRSLRGKKESLCWLETINQTMV